MTDAQLRQLFRRAGRDLDRRQRQRLEDLRRFERDLYDALVASLLPMLKFSNGRIASRVTDKAIDRAIRSALRSSSLTGFRSAIAKDIKAIGRNTDDYYQAIMQEDDRKGFSTIRDRIHRRTANQMGLSSSGVTPGGFIARAFVVDGMLEAIRSVVTSSIAGRSTQPELLRALRIEVKGTADRDGIATQELGELLVDTYTQADRNGSTGYGQALKFKWFTYEGGLIETSRQFCKERDGKVFNTVEAEEWRHDPHLPRTTKEKQTGVLIGYTPVANLGNAYGANETSMGRWRCRHRVRFISDQMAKRLAPEKFN